MTSILAVGAGSHLASVWRSTLPNDTTVAFEPHDAIDRPAVLQDRSIIVNFCRHPDLGRRLIAADQLPEVRLAKQVAKSKCHLIQLSSRRVYAPARGIGNFSEWSPLGPTTIDGINKLAGESAIAELLGERLTILRLANVFGLELQSGRRTFMARLLSGLITARRATFDVGLSTVRDFLPDRQFARALDRILARPILGTFNLGSGLATSIGEIAAWTISGFGEGTVVCSNDETHDEYVLDMSHFASHYGQICTADEIKDYCHWVGAMAKHHEQLAPTRDK